MHTSKYYKQDIRHVFRRNLSHTRTSTSKYYRPKLREGEPLRVRPLSYIGCDNITALQSAY